MVLAPKMLMGRGGPIWEGASVPLSQGEAGSPPKGTRHSLWCLSSPSSPAQGYGKDGPSIFTCPASPPIPTQEANPTGSLSPGQFSFLQECCSRQNRTFDDGGAGLQRLLHRCAAGRHLSTVPCLLPQTSAFQLFQ